MQYASMSMCVLPAPCRFSWNAMGLLLLGFMLPLAVIEPLIAVDDLVSRRLGAMV